MTRFARHTDREPELVGEAAVEPEQQRPAARQHQTLIARIGDELRRGGLEGVTYCVTDSRHGFLDRLAQLNGGHGDRLRRPGRLIDAADVDAALFSERPRAHVPRLHVLRSSLADAEPVLLTADG